MTVLLLLREQLDLHNAKYEHFGKPAARLDDIVNWLPARLTGLAFCLLTGFRGLKLIGAMSQEAPKHRSINAGWPESAMALSLGVRLGGPRQYAGEADVVQYVNSVGNPVDGKHGPLAIRLYDRLIVLVFVGLLATSAFGLASR